MAKCTGCKRENGKHTKDCPQVKVDKLIAIPSDKKTQKDWDEIARLQRQIGAGLGAW